MRILPTMSIQMPKLNTNKINFGAKVHDIDMPDNLSDRINLIRNEAKKLIGREVHDLETPLGNKKAVYYKYSNSFNVPGMGPNCSISICTYDNKLHSIFMHTKTPKHKGTQVIRTVQIYEGCSTAKNPVPAISYSAHIAKQPLSGYSVKYEPGSEISKEQSEPISKVIREISANLGLKE